MSAPSYADSPRDPTNYLGQSYSFAPRYIRKRNPTVLDIRPKENQGYYPIGSIWMNISSPPEIWILARIFSNSGVVNAEWVLIANGLINGPLLTLSDNAGTVVPPSSDVSNPPGNIQFVAGAGITIVGTPASNLITITNTGTASNFAPDTGTNPVSGTTVTFTNTTILATGTLTNAIRSNGTGASTIAYQLQYAGSNAGASAASKWGVAQFDSNQFSVASGFVQLAGGTTAPILGLVPDAHTAPGTTPVIPNGSGNIILEGGATFATGTQANPIRTNSLAANTIDLQIQLAGSNAAVSTANNFGVSQFDSNSFVVASGFVTLKNGGTTGAVTGLLGDDGGGNTVVPSSGVITLDGVTVTNATNAKPVFFKKNAASIEELDVQLTTTSTSGAKNINKSGLAHFDSASFTVDAATGFVSLTSGGTDIQTLTGNSGGAISPVAGNINTVGTGSITIAGAGSTLTTQLTGLTNHAIQIGAGTATLTQLVAGTTGQVLQTNTGADPTWSTATYPSTTTINQILYSSSNNVVAGLATVNSSSLATTSAGVPTWLGPMTNGQVVIGSTGATPVASTLTAGSGISITNGAGSVTISGSGGGFTWQDQGVNLNPAVSGNGYFSTAAITITLPAAPSNGTSIAFIVDTTSALVIQASGGQTIRIAGAISSAGGNATSNKRGDSVELIYRSTDTTWLALNSQGTWTMA